MVQNDVEVAVHGAQQSMNSCSHSDTSVLLACATLMPSMTALAPNDQQSPNAPWSFAGVTALSVYRLVAAEAGSTVYTVNVYSSYGGLRSAY